MKKKDATNIKLSLKGHSTPSTKNVMEESLRVVNYLNIIYFDKITLYILSLSYIS